MIDGPLRFTDADMRLFGAASGDLSPIHADPAFARRTAFGACIVYGGLETLGMLAQLPMSALAKIRSVSSSFPCPVLPGEPLSAKVRMREDRGLWEVRLTGRGKLVARLVASAGADQLPETSAASELSQTIDREYEAGPEATALTRRFGLEAVDPAVIEGILWASHVVGMTIPDFRGLCATVTIASGGSDVAARSKARSHVVLRSYDERTDRLLIDGTLRDAQGRVRSSGVIECFPFDPTPLPDSVGLPQACEPVPQRGVALVIGASRGLGAAVVLALLASGYAVHGVYARSDQAAAELFRLAGAYACRLTMHRLDAGNPHAVTDLVARLDDVLDGIAVCAAPPALSSALTGQSTAYVAESLDLAVQPLGAVLPRLRKEAAWVVLCSSPAVTAPRRDLPQLAMAKSAIEGLGGWIAEAFPSLRVIVARPPRMRTDLANTPAARAAAVEPGAVAAALLERLHGHDLAPGLTIFEPTSASLAAGTPVPA